MYCDCEYIINVSMYVINRPGISCCDKNSCSIHVIKINDFDYYSTMVLMQGSSGSPHRSNSHEHTTIVTD